MAQFLHKKPNPCFYVVPNSLTVDLNDLNSVQIYFTIGS